MDLGSPNLRVASPTVNLYDARQFRSHSGGLAGGAVIARSVSPDCLSSVLAIGYPFGPRLSGAPTVSRGILSGVREVEGITLVQTDAAMAAGRSGGAIVDMQGHLTGLAAGGLALSGGVNFGVAAESIRGFLDGVPLVGPDAAEPDDRLEQARPLSVNAPPEPRTLHTAGDVDWVSLPLSEDDRIVLLTDSPNCDTYLQFYAADGTLLDEDDDGGRNASSRIEFTVPEDGTYYARISHFQPTGMCRSYSVAAQSMPAL